MPDIPTKEPTLITAGDRVEWTRYDLIDDYPTVEYVMACTILSSAQRYVVPVFEDAEGYRPMAAPAVTATWAAGDYTLVCNIESDLLLQRFEVYRGSLTIRPDDTAAVDLRTHAKTVLDALEAVIEGRATHDQLAYSIRGRSVTRMSADELIRWRDYYRAEYQRELDAERVGRGEPTHNKLLVRF